eukprot:1640021-Lingulodinium_polyedra.AAC.1
MAAGAAIAWERSEEGWVRRETRTWVTPRGASSTMAEGWAARVALELAASDAIPPGPTTMVGGNLGIV